MRKRSGTVRYTAKQIKTKIARGEDRTNWTKVNATTGAKLEASIRADVDDVHGDPGWTWSVMGVPSPKDHINIRIDHDVLEWFKKNGRGYQTLMNNVLRAFVQTRQQGESMKSR
ncbi:MAG: BrnA antitoxin family protein [Candidatus Sulfotelmatobacter sp.]